MLNAPIPPVPLPPLQPGVQVPAHPVSPDPEISRQVQRVQELLRHPELPGLFREAVQRFQALHPTQQTLQTRQKDQRVRVRSNVQLAKRRIPRLQRLSYVRMSARAEAEAGRIRSARDVAALAQKRYHFLFTNSGLICGRLRELDKQFAELLQAEEDFPPQLPDGPCPCLFKR